MKKLITLLFFTFTVSLFGQMKEYKKATNLYNDKKFSEANIILEKLINKEYGELEQEMAFYVLYMNAGCYYNLNDFKIAYKKYEELIVFVKNSVNLFSSQTGKEEQIASLEKFKEDFKSKISKDDITSIQSDSNVTANSGSNENITKANSDNKTVTLTVSGTGKTLEEARLNALRSAIEQAFGAFISSKTEILNDNLVKDEIVSVSSGNIEKYNIISQTEIPNNGYAITLSATVSIEKLTTFAQSKGIKVEFNGGMFGIKIKLQKLNEEAEIVSLKNLLETSYDILNNSLDFELNVVSEPKLNFNNVYSLDFLIKIKPNNNYNKFEDYIIKTVEKLSLTPSEISEYISLNKKVYSVNINEKKYTFRTMKSKILFVNFLISCQILTNSFKFYSNEKIIKFTYDELYKSILNQKIPVSISKKPVLLNAFYSNGGKVVNKGANLNYVAPLFKLYINNLNLKREELLTYLTFNLEAEDEWNIYIYDGFSNQLSINNEIIFDTRFSYPEIAFTKLFSISDLEKISEFKLDKIDIDDFLKNRNLYMMSESYDELKKPNSEIPKKLNSKSSSEPAK